MVLYYDGEGGRENGKMQIKRHTITGMGLNKSRYLVHRISNIVNNIVMGAKNSASEWILKISSNAKVAM